MQPCGALDVFSRRDVSPEWAPDILAKESIEPNAPKACPGENLTLCEIIKQHLCSIRNYREVIKEEAHFTNTFYQTVVLRRIASTEPENGYNCK